MLLYKSTPSHHGRGDSGESVIIFHLPSLVEGITLLSSCGRNSSSIFPPLVGGIKGGG